MTRRQGPRSPLCRRKPCSDIPPARGLPAPTTLQWETVVRQSLSRTGNITRGKEDELDS
jgi:hypothetical protein